MSMADFKASLAGAAPAPGLDAPLAALWWAAKGKWDEAHHLVQDESTASAAWVHAYLHRVEGDLGNAGYDRMGPDCCRADFRQAAGMIGAGRFASRPVAA